MNRDRKFMAVYHYAICLKAVGATETFDDVAMWLNRHGIQTSYGTSYSGGRGVARMINAAYNYACNELGLGAAGAAAIAEVFTNKNGHYAYE